MILSTFINRVNYRLRGQDDDPPGVGTPERAYWIDTLNMKKDELYQDVKKQWGGTYTVLELGTISASADPSFDLDETFLSAASSCYVIDTNGQRHDFDVIEPQDRDVNKQQVFVAGQDPQILYFSQEILSTSNLIGGTLYLPCYAMPDDVTDSDGAYIPLPDANWGVYAVAAELAANDLSYEDKEGNLTAKANNLHSQMVKNNRGGTAGSPRKAKAHVQPIRGY